LSRLLVTYLLALPFTCTRVFCACARCSFPFISIHFSNQARAQQEEKQKVAKNNALWLVNIH